MTIDEILRLDEFALIVLDACRYDVFERIYRDYVDGELHMIDSGASCTIEWLINTFTDRYDLVYISACGFVLSKHNATTDFGTFSARRHFKKVVDVFLTDWDDRLGSVPPDRVVRRALENVYPRMIVHFLQPHFPCIGRPKLLMNEKQATELLMRRALSRDRILRAYEGNLRLVLENVRELVRELPHRFIAITSDHGEILGEHGFIDHPCGTRYWLLRHVPLLVVRKPLSHSSHDTKS